MDHKPFDDIFKETLGREPAAFLGLLGIEALEVSPLPPGACASLEVDYLAWVRLPDGVRLVHMEFERSPDATLPKRLILYNAVLANTYGVEVLTILVLAADGPRRAFPRRVAYGPLTLDVPVLRLRDHAEILTDPRLAELGLLTVPVRERPNALVRASETLLSGDRADQIASLLRLARALRMNSGTLTRLEVRMSVLLRQAEERGMQAGLQAGLLTGRAKGIEEGIEKGIERGIEKGIEEGLRQGRGQLALAALAADGLVVDPALVGRLGALTDTQVVDILRRARTGVRSLSELLASVEEAPGT